MATTARPLRRTTVSVVASLAVLLLTPGAAVADSPASDQSGCSLLLARAASWPGGFVDESGATHRLVSDAYASYLSAQPLCSSSEG